MLIFYGVALISASNYTFSNTRYLGYAEIALGLADSFVENYALLFWVVGFGHFHIDYGIIFQLKYCLSIILIPRHDVFYISCYFFHVCSFSPFPFNNKKGVQYLSTHITQSSFSSK